MSWELGSQPIRKVVHRLKPLLVDCRLKHEVKFESFAAK